MSLFSSGPWTWIFINKILYTHWLSVYRAAGSCEKILSWRRSDGFPSPSSQPQQTTQQPGSALVCSHWSDLPVDSAFRYARISSTVCLEHCDLLLFFLIGWKNNSCTDSKLCCFFSPPVTVLCISLLPLGHLRSKCVTKMYHKYHNLVGKKTILPLKY